jgi:ferritin-like metal-binding protein YciE
MMTGVHSAFDKAAEGATYPGRLHNGALTTPICRLSDRHPVEVHAGRLDIGRATLQRRDVGVKPARNSNSGVSLPSLGRQFHMPAVQTLQALYIEELRDLCSANNQMQAVVGKMADRASDQKLQALLQRSVTGIGEHTQAIRAMLSADAELQCRGMEGLVEEATRHAIEADLPSSLRDIGMIAQYQRMSHYGIAGFGTAAAYANALGQTEQANTLRTIVSDIYRADEYTSAMAESLEAITAADEQSPDGLEGSPS